MFTGPGQRSAKNTPFGILKIKSSHRGGLEGGAEAAPEPPPLGWFLFPNPLMKKNLSIERLRIVQLPLRVISNSISNVHDYCHSI
jgi:hypothetical protein